MFRYCRGFIKLFLQRLCLKKKLNYIFGDEVDVLSRLIKCGEKVKATDVLRITTENPFVYLDNIEIAWKIHQQNNNDLTATDGGPLGTHFEIFKLKTLIKVFLNNYNLYIIDVPKEPKFKTFLSKSRLVNNFSNDVNFEFKDKHFKDKQFINYLNNRINLLIPCSVIENYKKNVEFMYKQNWPRFPLALC